MQRFASQVATTRYQVSEATGENNLNILFFPARLKPRELSNSSWEGYKHMHPISNISHVSLKWTPA